MHYQKKVKAVIAVFLCTVLCIATLTAPAINAQAASVEPGLKYIIDIMLSKVGVHASDVYLENFVQNVKDAWETERAGYETYCTENGLDPTNIESQWEYRDNCLTYNIHKYMIAGVYAGMTHGGLLEGLSNSALVNRFLDVEDSTDISSSDEINISDEAVEAVYEDFQNYIEKEGLGYFYVPVKSHDKLPVDYFTDKTSYDNMVAYVESSANNTRIEWRMKAGGSFDKYTIIYDNAFAPYYVVNPVNNGNYNYVTISMYDENWGSSNLPKAYYDTSGLTNVNFTNQETFSAVSQATNQTTTAWFTTPTALAMQINFFAKEAGKQIVFTSVSAMKEYSVGIRPVYYTTNNTYDNSVDNSIKVSGDYLINNGTYSYDTINNEIQNGDIVNDNSINEIVNSNNQTIINNYYTESSGGDNSGGDSGGGSGGIGSLISGIGDLLDFVVGVIGDLISVLTGFLDTIYELLKSVGGVFTNFSGLLGELFVFIPEELIKLLTAGIGAGIAIALWKMFRR